MTIPIALELSDEALEQLAQRVAQLLGVHEPERFEGYLDVPGAAELLACPRSRIYALVSARRIPFYKDGSRTLFDPAEIRDWVRAGGGKRP